MNLFHHPLATISAIFDRGSFTHRSHLGAAQHILTRARRGCIRREGTIAHIQHVETVPLLDAQCASQFIGDIIADADEFLFEPVFGRFRDVVRDAGEPGAERCSGRGDARAGRGWVDFSVAECRGVDLESVRRVEGRRGESERRREGREGR
jgi:hypothetical protein